MVLYLENSSTCFCCAFAFGFNDGPRRNANHVPAFVYSLSLLNELGLVGKRDEVFNFCCFSHRAILLLKSVPFNLGQQSEIGSL
jgi:hypothetical protein